MNITPQVALENLVTVYKTARLTAEEHEVLKESVKVLYNLINQNGNSKGNSESSKGNSK
jgi:hypothetical protein